VDEPNDDGEQLLGDHEMTDISLDNLGAAYAKAAAEHDQEAFVPPPRPPHQGESSGHGSADEAEPDDEVVTPEAIVEAALFVGHPENRALSANRLASLIRGVSPGEVDEIVARLNQSYVDNHQALRIASDDRGYRLTVAPQLEGVHRAMMGKVREARLSQMAIEVLSLVAYQPGITAQKVQDQRGQESNALLNQMVRRQLLRVEKEKPPGGGRAVARYYTTERFLVLFGLESIEDLPHVEEGFREG